MSREVCPCSSLDPPSLVHQKKKRGRTTARTVLTPCCLTLASTNIHMFVSTAFSGSSLLVIRPRAISKIASALSQGRLWQPPRKKKRKQYHRGCPSYRFRPRHDLLGREPLAVRQCLSTSRILACWCYITTLCSVLDDYYNAAKSSISCWISWLPKKHFNTLLDHAS